MEKKIEKEEIEILDLDEIRKNEAGGIFIHIDIICDERLDWFEKTLISLYREYTELYGKCTLTAKQILDMLGNKRSVSTFHRAKRHLRELGMIECDGKTTIYTKK